VLDGKHQPVVDRRMDHTDERRMALTRNVHMDLRQHVDHLRRPSDLDPCAQGEVPDLAAVPAGETFRRDWRWKFKQVDQIYLAEVGIPLAAPQLASLPHG
jgi:hypothetical protein